MVPHRARDARQHHPPFAGQSSDILSCASSLPCHSHETRVGQEAVPAFVLERPRLHGRVGRDRVSKVGERFVPVSGRCVQAASMPPGERVIRLQSKGHVESRQRLFIPRQAAERRRLGLPSRGSGSGRPRSIRLAACKRSGAWGRCIALEICVSGAWWRSGSHPKGARSRLAQAGFQIAAIPPT